MDEDKQIIKDAMENNIISIQEGELYLEGIDLIESLFKNNEKKIWL